MNGNDHDLLENIRHRMDAQDRMLLEIRDTITAHIAAEKEVKPALDELITLWKGSKLIIPILVGSATAIWAVVTWAKDHVKL